MLSIVIPTLNEAAQLPETLHHARAVPEVQEIIVVDGGSADATIKIAEELGCRVMTSPPSRGGQMRCGAKGAMGDVIVLLHADTWLPQDAGREIDKSLEEPDVVGGGFTKTFRERHMIQLGAKFRSALLFYLGGPLLGDQGMFVRREALERIGGVPDMPLMEEFELCRQLRRIGRLTLARTTVSASMRRFAKHGVLQTYWRMCRVVVNYYFGTPPKVLARLYGRG